MSNPASPRQPDAPPVGSPVKAIQALLRELIDYAGLFPPAGLALPPVVQNFHQYSVGDDRWMLGRLIVPARQLEDLQRQLEKLFSGGQPDSRWRISSLIPEFEGSGDSFRQSLEQVQRFNQACSHAVVDTVEGKATSPASIGGAIRHLPVGIAAFLEIPFSGSRELIQEIARSQNGSLRGKMRTGGITPELIPDSSLVASFIADCAEWKLPFKATAGLHHSLRAVYPLTYETASPRSIMHGFMNVFAAAIFAWSRNWPAKDLMPVLECTDPAAFRIDAGHLHFYDESLNVDEIKEGREKFAVSFGSCSFTEPADEIRPFLRDGR